MADDPFAGLADIFIDTFGEAEGVVYIPLATGVAVGDGGVIAAIWWESSMDVAPAIGIAADAGMSMLYVRASDVAAPAEGDTARRVSDGKLMTITPPILPDGKGMISCNLT